MFSILVTNRYSCPVFDICNSVCHSCSGIVACGGGGGVMFSSHLNSLLWCGFFPLPLIGLSVASLCFPPTGVSTYCAGKGLLSVGVVYYQC
jgi:hypothetical protein